MSILLLEAKKMQRDIKPCVVSTVFRDFPNIERSSRYTYLSLCPHLLTHRVVRFIEQGVLIERTRVLCANKQFAHFHTKLIFVISRALLNIVRMHRE